MKGGIKTKLKLNLPVEMRPGFHTGYIVSIPWLRDNKGETTNLSFQHNNPTDSGKNKTITKKKPLQQNINQILYVSLSNSYVEALILSVIVFGDRAFRELSKVKWYHRVNP